jgi:hypothetical protein
MINEVLLITEPPSGNLILGDRTLEEIEEEKKQFNKMKLLEAMKKLSFTAEEIVDVDPMYQHNKTIMISKDRGNNNEKS